MELAAAQLPRRLDDLDALSFLIHGVETLLVDEARDRIRTHLAGRGFADLTRFSVESGFDWNDFSRDSRSMSLFSARRCLELRISNPRVGDAGAAVLKDFAERGEADTALVVLCGKLDKKLLAAPWCRAFVDHGVVVDTGTVAANRLPAWIAERFSAHGVGCTGEAAERLAWYVEGNLLAADQEVRKLALSLSPGARLDAGTLEQVMADHARFSVFTLVDACVAGNARRGLRILRSLRRDGTEPVLLVWALAREARTLALVGADIKSGVGRQDAFRRQRIWSSRAPLVMSALKRLGLSGVDAVQRRLAECDRRIKGQLPGSEGPADVWFELERAALAICGINPLKTGTVYLSTR